MKWKEPETGEMLPTGTIRMPKVEAEYNERIAILTGGPSLEYTWHDGFYECFREVWAINMVGKRWYHDYVYYLDTPERIFGDKDVKQWPKTLKGFRDRKILPIDRDCTITFPACFDYVMKKSRASARIYIFGWDCAGTGVVDGRPWDERDNEHTGDKARECELALMKKYWNADKVAGVSGKMQQWARENLGFNAGPLNRFSKPDPPPRKCDIAD